MNGKYMQELLELELKGMPLRSESQVVIDDLERVLLEEQTSLGIILSYYYKEQGGLVENVLLADKIHFETPTGTFRVSFKVVHFNACWDIHGTNDESMLLAFKLNDHPKRLKLYGPSWPEREQNEI